MTRIDRPRPARSTSWFGGNDLGSFLHRVFAKGMGYGDDDLTRPIIGICSTWSELNHCNRGLRDISEAVKRGVLMAGGLPLEFPTISLGEFFVAPTSMLLRNLAAMDTEEMIRAQPIDGVVLLAGCDKTTPAQLMGAASANVPAIMVTAGPMLNGRFDGKDLGACTDCRRYWTEFRAGTVSGETMEALESALARSVGHCMVMGTASTMAALAEALGMMLPGGAAIPGPDSRRLLSAEQSGKHIVQLVAEQILPSDIMTADSFKDAIRVLHSLGGSTNAVVHLPAIAGRLGIPLPLELFDELSRETPWLANLRPSGEYQMEQFFEAGGVPAIMKELAPLLHLDRPTVTGRSVGENLRSVKSDRRWRDVVATRAEPLSEDGGLAVLHGNLAPNGAVIKHSAASPNLLKHRGRAIVFKSPDDLNSRVDDPELAVAPDNIMVMQGGGPIGAPGMPEIGNLPIPRKLLAMGVRDMVRISDARMSGTSFGTVVLHVAPESAVGGPLAAVQNGDLIELDVPNRRLELILPDREIKRRLENDWHRPPAPYSRGYGKLFIDHVLQAPDGCDFDFLTGPTTDQENARASLQVTRR